MFTCKKCNITKPIVDFPISKDRVCGHYANCKVCKIAYQKQYSKTEAGKKVQYEADQSRKEKFAHKRSARSKTFHAIKNGTIQVLPCLICGDKAEAHHHDYSRPLDVMWLCKAHHRETHLLTKGN
jgi:transcription elongation factor Elf1